MEAEEEGEGSLPDHNQQKERTMEPDEVEVVVDGATGPKIIE